MSFVHWCPVKQLRLLSRMVGIRNDRPLQDIERLVGVDFRQSRKSTPTNPAKPLKTESLRAERSNLLSK